MTATKSRRVILVTGAPRTATTPVGNTLATAKGAVSLYEPLGPTGLCRFDQWFPMLEPGFGETDLKQLMADLRDFRFGSLKKQQREGTDFSWKRYLIGSRTRATLRLAQLHPWAKVAIWKDPHAIFLAADVVQAGGQVVVTARRAKAHAGSYRRLGWVSRAAEIYPRWSQRFGRCEVIEAALPEAGNPVVSAALIWRLSYLALLRAEVMDRISIVTSDALIEDERGTYMALFERLELTSSAATQKAFRRAKPDTKGKPNEAVIHDWTRSVAAANSYWQDILTTEEATKVDEITADVEAAIFD